MPSELLSVSIHISCPLCRASLLVSYEVVEHTHIENTSSSLRTLQNRAQAYPSKRRQKPRPQKPIHPLILPLDIKVHIIGHMYHDEIR